jgi:16S rRNA (guanine527-N7)-methyltransferase
LSQPTNPHYKNQLGETIEVKWRVGEWFKDLGPEKLDKLSFFHEELLKFNQTINLIGVKTIPQADVIHFGDCIIGARHIVPLVTNREIWDIGSGNGFPGLVMGIIYPDLKVNLVDADQRKCEFLKHVAGKLAIQNIQVLNTQIEKIPDNSVTFGVCRGFASISKALLGLRKVFKKGGILFHFKGEEWFTEVSGMATQLCTIWKAGLVTQYRLPATEVEYAIVRTDKIVD